MKDVSVFAEKGVGFFKFSEAIRQGRHVPEGGKIGPIELKGFGKPIQGLPGLAPLKAGQRQLARDFR